MVKFSRMFTGKTEKAGISALFRNVGETRKYVTSHKEGLRNGSKGFLVFLGGIKGNNSQKW